jgi:ATP-dependent Lhr-like helicase
MLRRMALESFHPTIRRWFTASIGAPSPPQVAGWPKIRAGHNTLIAAPTGTGKTLAAFLYALDELLREGPSLPDECRVLYVSPLKALSNDVAKNLQRPLAELRELDATLPDVRVLVRTGDTPQKDRVAMGRRPPHVLVTTPESLYILLGSASGRSILRTVRTVIVDEIHALARDKRGAHFALSLERLEALTARSPQRIGLSATQRPLDVIGRFLGGVDRPIELVDVGHRRVLDLGIEVPEIPLSAVCSHEMWDEIHERIAALSHAHKTTLVFVNTRKLAERLSARLGEKIGPEIVACHHGSLARETRLLAEQRLKAGELKVLVATASLELGIDIGDVDLVLQIGAARSINTFLQRAGRAGHGLDRVPKARLFPLTRDELVESAALLWAIREGELDRASPVDLPLDILAQQIVAACVEEAHDEQALYERFKRAWPFRALTREQFDRVVAIHAAATGSRDALLHRDGVGGQLRATKRARLRALLSGGAIPDLGEYEVRVEPEGVRVGSVHEDFAVEANRNDVFQLGNNSWRVIRVETGVVRVEDAGNTPPSLPFWVGEAPGRSAELATFVSRLREECDGLEWIERRCGVTGSPAEQLWDYVRRGREALGCAPTQQRLVIERFPDEGGGQQIVFHAPFGARTNRALGLAMRKRICRGFGFELQAAATEDALVFSLAEEPAVALDVLFDFLKPRDARHLLEQAILVTPLFQNRWRWNASRALLFDRMQGGRSVPLLLQRMRANDLLARAFPQCLACPETLDSPDVEIPTDQPLVTQTIEDTLHEAMDVDAFLRVVGGLADGSIERVTVESATPSPFAEEVLNGMPYTFLDDAPLEERRSRAVQMRGASGGSDELPRSYDGEVLDAILRETWPDPHCAEDVHEALSWMGYVTTHEADAWLPWLAELEASGRVARDGERWYASDANRDPRAVARGRLDALAVVFESDDALLELEREGSIVRVTIDGRPGFCDRRILKRLHRRVLERMRKDVAPVALADYFRFMARWQHVAPESKLEGPRGVAAALAQLQGFAASAPTWEESILPARVAAFDRAALDEVTRSGEFAFGRFWGGSGSALKVTPLAFATRDDLDTWMSVLEPASIDELSGDAAAVLDALRHGGAVFPAELLRKANLLPDALDRALAELVARGLATADAFAHVHRWMKPSDRRMPIQRLPGRIARFRGDAPTAPFEHADDPRVEFAVRVMLARYGVVFRTVVRREPPLAPWRFILRYLRRLELRGDVRGGRFVLGTDGEQYALPSAVEQLRAVRREREEQQLTDVQLPAGDPADVRDAFVLQFSRA